MPGHLTPSLQEASVRLSTWMPFARAAKEFQWFTHVTVTEPLTRRLAEAAGAAYVEFQTAEVERLERTAPEPPEGPALQLVSVDGATVPLVQGEWGEVKTLVVGTVQPPLLEKGEWVVHSTELSYFSRLTEAETFTRLATVETHRRGVERAGRVCGVTDGAVWEQGFLDVQRQDAIRILDFPHATEYLTRAGQGVHGEDTPEVKTWLAETAHELKHGSPDVVLNHLRALEQEASAHSAAQAEIVQDSLNYLEKRRTHIEYAQFQVAGYPLGSGAVESGNKLVVEARLKGAGRHWARPHVNPMLALRNTLRSTGRNIACSDRWEEAWPVIEHWRGQQDRLRQEHRRQQRRLKQPAATAMPRSGRPEHVRSGRPPSASHRVKSTQAGHATRRAHRPPGDHPWRHMPIGRAIFLPRKPRSSAKE